MLRFPVGEHDYEPRLMRLEPANGATRVYANSDVKLVFNKEVVLPADFEMTFTDEAEHAITLRYAEEKDKVLGNLAVVENTVVVRGKMLPAGHTYSVTMDAADDHRRAGPRGAGHARQVRVLLLAVPVRRQLHQRGHGPRVFVLPDLRHLRVPLRRGRCQVGDGPSLPGS